MLNLVNTNLYNPMTTHLLFPEISKLFYGHDSGINAILKQAQTPGSGILYLINSYSQQDEISALQKVLAVESREKISWLIRKHLDTMARDIPCLESENVIDLYAYKLPVPPPPPPPPFIPTSLRMVRKVCFFTRNATRKVLLIINGKEVGDLKRAAFFDLTNIYVACMPRGLGLQNGDKVTLKIQVEYLDNKNNPQKNTIEYNQIIF